MTDFLTTFASDKALGALVHKGQGPALIANNDFANTIWISDDIGVQPNGGNAAPLPPQASVVVDGSTDIYVVTLPGLSAQVVVIPGGQNFFQLSKIKLGSTVLLSPSGDTTGVTDLNVMQTLLNSGLDLQLAAGIYFFNNSLLIPTNASITGAPRAQGVPADNYGISGLPLGSTVIKPVFGFAGTAVLKVDNSAHLIQAGNITIDNIGIDGSLMGANTVDGIKTIGSVAKVRISDCTVYNMGQHGINLDIDAGSNPPISPYIRSCHLSKCGGYGVRIIGGGDGTFFDTECSTNGNGGWLIQNTPNMRMVGCKAEWSGNGPGYELKCTAGSNLYATLVGCTSEHNWTSGIQIDGGNPGNNGTVVIDGYQSVADNRGVVAGTAGILSNGAGVRVMVIGARADGSTTYGASQIANSYSMYLTACALFGLTAATNDDGTNTLALVSQDQIPQDPPHPITTGFPAGWTGSINYFQLHESRLIMVNVNLSVAAGTAITVGEVINTLPVGYRPTSRKQYACDASPNVAADFAAEIQIQTSGNITWTNPAFTVGAGDTLLLRFDLIFTTAI